MPTGAVLTNTSNFQPFAPNGFKGIFKGASVVFFAYLVSWQTTQVTGEAWGLFVTVHAFLMLQQLEHHCPMLVTQQRMIASVLQCW